MVLPRVGPVRVEVGWRNQVGPGQFGPDGTTVERIAGAAGVNKERVYNYFGNKRSLFTLVLRDELMKVAQAVPIESFATEDVGDYAGRAYDYHRQHPELTRLLRWEGLVLDDQIPDEELHRRHYEYKSRAMSDGQAHGAITTSIDAGHLFFLVLSLAGWWSAAPQVARMLTGAPTEEEHARRRASVVEAARRLARAP